MQPETAGESRIHPDRLPAVHGALLMLSAELQKDCDCVRSLTAEAPQLLDSDPGFLAESLSILRDNLARYHRLVRLLLRHELDTTRCHALLIELEGLTRRYADRVEHLLGVASDLG